MGRRSRGERRREGAGRERRGRTGRSAERGSLDGLPGWLAPLVFLAVTLVLFREFVLSDLMLLGQDTLALGYVARAFYAEALGTVGFPLWNPFLLGGTPFLESLAGGDSLYPPSVLLLLLLETYRALGWKLILHVFLAGCFMYGWLRMVGISRGGSLVGGLAYLLAPYMVSLVYPGHDGKLFVTALTPLLFWVVEWLVVRRGLIPLAAVGGVVTLVILTTHFQMAYFLFGAVGAYMAFRCVEVARGGEGWPAAGKLFGSFLLFSVLGAGGAGLQLIPAADYVMDHSRRAHTTVDAAAQEGLAWASSWSLHPEEVAALVVPEFVGNDAGGAEWTTGTYWGRNFFKHNHEYLGLVVLLLASLSFLGGARRGLRWFLATLGGVALLYALGAHTPVWRLFYELVPGISLFRSPSMAIFLTGFAATTLAGLGVDRGVELSREGKWGGIGRVLGGWTAVLALGFLLAAAGALTGAWTTVLRPEMDEVARRALETAGPFITRGFLLATLLSGSTLLVWWALGRGYLKPVWAVLLLGGLVMADQVRVNDPFIQHLDFHQFAAPDTNHRYMMEQGRDGEPFRVFSMVQRGQDVTAAMHGLEMAAGHHPNDLGRYRELIGMVGSGVPENLARFNPNVLGLLNVHYILWPDFQLGALEGPTPVSQVQFADRRVYTSLYRYPGLPRARVVGEALVVPEEEALEWILDPDRYDPARQVVLTEDPPLELGGAEVAGQVRWLERTPNRLVLEVESTGPALLVISDNWFPAWHASVNDEEVPVLRADHTLRAVPVLQGLNRVEMWYDSLVVKAGAAVSLLSLLLLGGAATGGLLLERQRRAEAREEREEEEE